MKAQFQQLEMQVAAMNAEMKAFVVNANGAAVNPDKYAKMQQMMARNSATFRNAAASTGMFEAEQLKLNSATDNYVRALEKQKLSFRDWRKNMKVSKAAYEEQLALQNMVVRKMPGTQGNRGLFDVIIPNEVSKDMDTLGKRIGWIREQTRSAATQMINWGKNTQWAGRQLMVGFTMPLAAFGAAAGVMRYKVDQELTRIAKVYDTTAQIVSGDNQSMMAVEKELADVRVASMNTAMNAAKAYGSSVTDTLKVQAELAATGLNGNKLQSATQQVMRIATLGELDTTQATALTISLQTAFKNQIKTTEDLTNAFNFMNATENATSLSTQDIAESIPRAGSAMAALGVSVQEATVMLVSMKESGVDAAEAANALKSATGTILAPSPAADEFIKQISKGRVQVTELAAESNGNLYVALHKLYDQMQGLSALQKQQILVKLFGKYQFNRVSAMLTNLGRAWEGTQNQSHKAMELMGKDASSLAQTADQELKRQRESASGQFKIMLETLKGELALMGEPFLQVATDILKGLAKIASAFNDLPSGIKKFAAYAAIAGALIGPTIMLIGLFANLTGNLLKFGVAATRWAGKMEIVNKESRAAKLAAELAGKGYISERQQAVLLTMQLEKLALAQAHANRMARESVVADMVASRGIKRSQAVAILAAQRRQTLISNGSMVAGTPASGRQGAAPMAGVSTGFVPKTASQIAAESEKTGRAWKGIAGNTALAASSMILMMGTQKGMVHNMATMVFYASMLTPLLSGLFQLPWKTIGLTIKTNIAFALFVAKDALIKMAAAAKTFALAMLRAPVSTMATGMRSALAVLVGMLGPAGLIAAAVAAAGFAAWKWHQHNVQIAKDQVEQEKAIVSQKNLLANALDIQIRKQKELNTLTATDKLGDPTVTAHDLADQIPKQPGGKDLVSSMKNTDDAGQTTIAMQKYVQVLNAVGGSSVKARKYVEALFIAAGDGALEAETKARGLYDTIGNVVDESQQVDLWSRMISSNKDSGNMKEAAVQGTSLGKALADSMATAVRGEARGKVFQSMNDAMEKSFAGLYDNLDARTQQFMSNIGVHSAAALRQAMKDNAKYVNGQMSGKEFSSKYGGQTPEVISQELIRAGQQMGDQGRSLQATEAAIVKELANQLNIKEKISTFDELRNTKEYQMQTATKAQAKQYYQINSAAIAATNAAKGMLGPTKYTTKQLQLQELNQWRIALGMRETGLLSDGFGRATLDINGNMIDWSTNVAKVNGKLALTARQLREIKAISDDDVLNMTKGAMSSFQQGIADATTSAFEADSSAAIKRVQQQGQDSLDAMNKRQEKAQNALDNRQQRAQDALDARQEKRRKGIESGFDKRIKGIQNEMDAEQKADDLRQKLFEAEMTRLDRLNESANRNIDFNVALNSGNLDEAAKIRNDAEAWAANNVLTDAGAAGTDASKAKQDKMQKQIDALEKAKDKRLEQISKVEKAEKDSLKRQQDREKAALKASQERRQKALQKQIDANNAAEQKKWETQKQYLDKALAHFMGYTATSDKDLRDHIKKWEERYKGFNLVTKGEFNTTSKNINQYLVQNLKDGQREFENEKAWATSGYKIANAMLKGAFGMNTQQFKQWLVTGVWPDKAKPMTLKDINKMGSWAAPGGTSANDKNSKNPAYHVGGQIGVDPGGRKGYARTAPLSRNEVPIVAEKGEYMVNKDAYSKHSDLIHAINNDNLSSVSKYARGPANAKGGGGAMGNIGGGLAGFSGLMGALMAKATMQTVAQGLQVGAGNAMVKQQAGTAGSYSAGKAGTYGNRSFAGDQMHNAAIIASVGKKMGMSTRDIEIGIMTAITESGLVNIHGGDRDSQGLFQQRPSQGWGTVAQVTDPQYAARKFFSVLQTVADRENMSPWMAAQTVQRSAFSDGSNYRQYWDEAQAIFNSGMKAQNTSGGGVGAGFVQGEGGWHKASVPGKGWVNSHDYRNGIGSPLFAASDGTVVDSRAITSGGTPGNGKYSTPYSSYGETIAIRTASGDILRYAHLSPGQRYVQKGQHVQGGALIGRSGMTGNASGPHTHFDVNGNYNALEWMRAHGIGLKTGGFTVSDGLANLHKNEVVVDPARTKKIMAGIDAQFAGGGNHNYNVNVNVSEPNANPQEIATYVMKAIKKAEARKPQSRRG